MTKECTLKEAFIESKLTEFQPNWKTGEDITAETKQLIKDYVAEKIPSDILEGTECITDYSIWHMAQKIREREGLPAPVHSNKGQISESEPDEVSLCKSGKSKQVSKSKPPLKRTVKKLLKHYSADDIIEVIKKVESEQKNKEKDPENDEISQNESDIIS
ncbi:MAG: hypothetical protein MUO43_12525 [Desulfobacterales bacterium]|nr:hypothetical protein [Desulfobacterales bacterium]